MEAAVGIAAGNVGIIVLHDPVLYIYLLFITNSFLCGHRGAHVADATCGIAGLSL